MAQQTMEPASEVLETPLTQGYLDLIRVAWRRKLLLVLGAVLGLAAGVAYYQWSEPAYKSYADVLVTIKRPGGLSVSAQDGELAYFQDFLVSHEAVIDSPLIVERAVAQGNLAALSSLAHEEDPVIQVCDKLTVNRDSLDSGNRNSAIFELSYRAGTPDDSRAVLSTVIDTYTEYLATSNRSDSDRVHELFAEWRDEIETQLGQKREDYRGLRRQTPPSLWKSKDGVNLSQERLAALVARRLDQLVRATQIERQLAALEVAKQDGASYQVLLEMMSKDAAASTGVLNRREKLFDYLVEEQALLQKYGPRHPAVIDVRERIKLTRGSFADPELQDGEWSLRELFDSYVQSLEHELEVTQDLDKSLGTLIDEEIAKAKQANDHSEDLEQVRNDIASIEGLHQEIIRQVQGLDLLKDSAVYHAQVISPPALGEKVAPKLFLILPVGLLLGLFVGSGAAGLAEVSDKSFRAPEEVRRHLGLPMLGHVPFDKGAKRGLGKRSSAGAKVAPVLCTYSRPKSTEAETYRGVRTALYARVRGTGWKTIQVTSPDVGDGKSTLAANLAVSIAQSGRTVALIDADFRRPRLHKVFGYSTKVGLSAVLAGEAELKDAVQASDVPGLDVLPCGTAPQDRTELLAGPRFKQLIDHAGEHYDFVLIDTPPLLVVADPCAIAQHVDGILLVVRNSRNGRPQAERAMEILSTLETDVLGVVVNNMDHRRNAKAFGYYGYRNGYGHADGRPRRRRRVASADTPPFAGEPASTRRPR
jgi:capsular exopolysaccharide synthesis family protein